jgi:uncharacterized SAM-binding protein YcdF (DUF218 family)
MKKTVWKIISFWLAEAVLLSAAAVFAFALVGYTTIALALVGVAVTAALYRLLALLAGKGARWARTFRVVLTVLLVAGLIWFAIVETPVVRSARTDENPEAPYLVVLGAGVNGTVPSLSLLDRLEAAKAYLDAYPEAKAVLSGAQGPGEEITEAECMRRWLTANGISQDRLLIEDQSRSTAGNIAFSLDVIAEDGGDPTGRVALVSSEYHLYRAKYLAHEQGAQPLGVAARTRYPVLRLNYFLREAFAVTALWIM